MPIPRILHQVWLGPKPFPEKFARFQETWLRHHPEWELRFWTEDTLPDDLACAAIYERLREPVERCDLMRLECLHRDGGVYVDCDFECRRAIDPLLEGTDFFLAYIGPNRVNHALMGATPGHAILARALAEVEPREYFGYDKEATGPAFFNRLLAAYEGVTVYPSSFFYPANESEREVAYAIHHAERSWQDGETMRHTLEKAYARLEDVDRARRRTEEKLAKRERQLADTKSEVRELRARLQRTPVRRFGHLIRRSLASLQR
jgi:inositol phosphorylceramide mannosyltransferase catalytic subunit